MSVTADDLPLYTLLSTADPKKIEDVIRVMQGIDDLLPDDDGLKWFNRLYLTVTLQVDLAPPAGGWKDTDWLLTLDVVFAGLYFRAVAAYLNGEAEVASSWSALMEARHTAGIDRIQFALAGMNAHINHDLALALVATGVQTGIVPSAASPQHVDYQAVNGLLNTVLPATLNMLNVDLLGRVAVDTGKPGRILAFWNLVKARDLAWDFGDHLRALPVALLPVSLTTQDRTTGALGRAILSFR